jgi:hypothetical protein
MKAGKTFSLSFFVLCLTICIALNVNAQEMTAGEYEVKAAFLVNFLKFVEWPRGDVSRTSACDICVLGHNPFGAALTNMQNTVVAGKRLTTKVCEEPREANNCHILFISASEKDRLGSILEEMKHSHVLTVGDMKGFARAGGVVQFVIEEDKVRFMINIDAADRAKLKISSKLLRLSRVFRE